MGWWQHDGYMAKEGNKNEAFITEIKATSILITWNSKSHKTMKNNACHLLTIKVTTFCGHYHNRWFWSLSISALFPRRIALSWILLDRGAEHGMSMVAIFVPLVYVLWSIKPQNHYSTHMLGFIRSKCANTSHTSRAKHEKGA